jgi:putative transposase
MMKLLRGYKTELAPDDEQLATLYKHAGAARFAYNWGLEWKNNVRAYNMLPHPKLKIPTAVDLHKELNRLKKTKLSWLYEVSKCAPQEALRDLDVAFSNFFGHHAGFPNFKSKKKGAGSFTLTGAISVRPGEVRLPRIGWVRLKERGYISSKAHTNCITVSERAGRWYVAVNVVEERKEPITPLGPVAGVNRGLNSLALVSDGTVLENPRVLRRYGRKLKHLQRNLSRKQKGSSNRRKTNGALARLNMRVVNTRLDAIQKFTTMLAKTKPVIVVEDLDVKKMMRNHHLARAIADAAWGEMLRQLRYKTRWYGSTLITADRWYPSTKRCSRCGHVKDAMSLEERVFNCEGCGLVVDRDLNAARNLAEWPGVARTLETPVEGGVQSTAMPLIQPPGESGTISLGRGPRR